MALTPLPTPPILSAQQAIAGDLRPTSQFKLFLDETRRAIIAADGSLAATDEDLQDQIDRLTAILAGTGEAFTGLKVGAQNVKPFLDKTNGTALTDSTGLANSVVVTAAIADSAVSTAKVADLAVSTAKVAVDAITSEAAAFTAATLPQDGLNETTVQTVSYTTTGETLEVKANFFLTIWHPTAGNITTTVRIYRGATLIYDQAFLAINGDLLQGWQTPTVIEQPAAGTYTFTATVQTDVSNWATAETSSRLLSVREFKR
jgi:hypothetical protein